LRIGVLNNLRAGRGSPDAQRVFELLQRRPDVLHVETEAAHDVAPALAELERAEVDVLVIHGGDGTVQLALSELLRDPHRTQLPAIAPLHGGRTNCTSTDLGADRHPAVGLARLLEAADAGGLDRLAVARPVLRVRSARRCADQYGMFFGPGIIYRAIQVVHRVFPPGRQGLFGASVVTGALVLKIVLHPKHGILAPDKCEVREDGRELADPELYLLIASTLDRLFLRMNPFWATGPGGVRLTAISSRAQRIARAAPGILRGRPPAWVTPERGYTSARLERAKLRISCGFTIDGELFAPEPEEEIELAADRRIRFLRA
jgi:diacylglycerol kinase (ATP)